MINLSLNKNHLLFLLLIIPFNPCLGSNQKNDSIQNFLAARTEYIDQVNQIKKNKIPWHKEDLLRKMKALILSYKHQDRKNLSADSIYQMQFQLRFSNNLLHTTLIDLRKNNLISKSLSEEIELSSHILKGPNSFYFQSPQKNLPIFGVKASEWPLSRWENDPEFYRYQFEGETLNYRGLNLKSGDILLNHPSEYPTGIFTSIADKRSVFSHGAMVIFLHRNKGRLPVVIDIHELGVRAVPLHHFLSENVITYGEFYRLKNPPLNYEYKLNSAIQKLMSVSHPYDLTGLTDRKALSCVEVLSYILELSGLAPFPIQHSIVPEIYKNILRFGKLPQIKFQIPNDVILDSRFEYIDFIDNTPSLSTIILNEVLLSLFRQKMIEQRVTKEKDLSRILGEFALNEMRTKNSFLGGFILDLVGFTRDTLPVGDPGLLTAVNAIDNAFSFAMSRCLGTSDDDSPGYCDRWLEQSISQGAQRYNFSITQWIRDASVRHAVNSELKEFDELFE